MAADAATPLTQRKATPKPAAPRKLKGGVGTILQPAEMWGDVMDARSAEVGGDMYLASEHRSGVGIPLPSLALCELLGTNIWRLGRVTELFGRAGSFKSCFLYELFRWHTVYDGYGWLLENENKEAETFLRSVLRTPQLQERVIVRPVDTLNEWQAALTEIFKRLETLAVKCKGYTMPMCLAVDSVMATTSDKAIEKINTDGSASLGYASESQIITKYLRSIPKKIRDTPWSLILTNHEKESAAATGTGMPEIVTPGGRHMEHAATVRIRMQSIRRLQTVEYGGARVKFSMKKNAMAPGFRQIEAEVKWKQAVDPETGAVSQTTWWDWPQASIEMLLARREASATLRDKLDEIVDLHVASGKRVWSKQLGIPSKEPLSFSEAGELLEARNDLMPALFIALFIDRQSVFETGRDYRAQRKEIAVLSGELEARRYAQDLELIREFDDVTAAMNRVVAAKSKAPLKKS